MKIKYVYITWIFKSYIYQVFFSRSRDIYLYIYMCVCVCVCVRAFVGVCVRERVLARYLPLYTYIYIHMWVYVSAYLSECTFVRGVFTKFPDFFVQAFKIIVDSWKFSMLLLYILWDDWPIFIISGLNEQLQQELEYTLLKPDCHSWWISKMQSGREDTLEEQYAIKFCFKLGKNATETYGMLQTAFAASCMNRASVFEWHKRFKEARETVRDRWWEVWEE